MATPIAEGRLQVPAGVRDILFREANILRSLENRLADLFTGVGCQEVRPPTLELTEALAPVAPDETTLYKLIDRSGRVLALRPDLTASVARLVATHFPSESNLRLWYAGQVYRYEQAQGRPHELRQAGVEWFGDASVNADTAMVMLAADALAAAEARQFQVVIGHTAVLAGLWDGCHLGAAERAALQQALVQQDHVAYEALTAQLQLPAELAQLLRDIVLAPEQDLVALEQRLASAGRFPQAVAGVQRLQAVAAGVRAARPELAPYVVVDFGLVRDFTYYTGLVLEGYVGGVPQPVLTGGRYDDLLAAYGVPRPALGFALDLSALAAVALDGGSERQEGRA